MQIKDRSEINNDFINKVIVKYNSFSGASEINDILNTGSIEYIRGDFNSVPITAIVDQFLEGYTTKRIFIDLSEDAQTMATALVLYFLRMVYCVSLTIYDGLEKFKIRDKSAKKFLFKRVKSSKLQLEAGDDKKDNFYDRALILYDVFDMSNKFLNNAYLTVQLKHFEGLCVKAINFASNLTNISDFFNYEPMVEISLINCNNIHNRKGCWTCSSFKISKITKIKIEEELSADAIYIDKDPDKLI